jgi:hypothetical protein
MEYLEYVYRLIVGNFQLIAGITLVFMLFKDREQLKIKWDKMSVFVGLMVFVSLVRLCLIDFQVYEEGISKIPQGFNRLRLHKFLWVGLEDVFFVMIPIYITNFCKTKILRFAIWSLFTAMFALGHSYQGVSAIFITGLYPYFISRYFTLKTSLATVMACHFIYDCFTFLTVKISRILPYL